ncbi:MAG: hypothetical protein FWB96_03865 [Defluviitaleaceae bacterium]|nr:hypothetical protein [Defluviitaleaceae bacterium]MCL2262110.1 hypothetical protein [Defluviitaleaceae bacterium]
MSHAYIFVGENKTAVRNHALAIAKGLNCERENACGNCLSCRVFDSGNHPDTVYVKGTKQSGIGVDDVREQVIMPMAVKPFKYKHKIFIIESADTLTPAAQNALLKTIEEPAPYGVFLFLANNTFNFLPTVLSRCVVKKITGEDAAPPELQALAEEIFSALQTADIPETFALYRKIEPLPKDALHDFLNALYILYGTKINSAAKNAQPTPQLWLNATAAITNTKKILSQNANTQLALELMLLKLRNT